MDEIKVHCGHCGTYTTGGEELVSYKPGTEMHPDIDADYNMERFICKECNKESACMVNIPIG